MVLLPSGYAAQKFAAVDAEAIPHNGQQRDGHRCVTRLLQRLAVGRPVGRLIWLAGPPGDVIVLPVVGEPYGQHLSALNNEASGICWLLVLIHRKANSEIDDRGCR